MGSTGFRWINSDKALLVGFLLNGMGVVLLGPLMPRLAQTWTLSDPQEGALLAAQFIGSSLGTVLVLRERRHAIFAGSICSWLGLSAVALLLSFPSGHAETEVLACLALLVYGFGLGQVITTLNVASGERGDRKAARLSSGNALWSIGAIISPVALGISVRHMSPARFLLWFAGILLLFAISSDIPNVRHLSSAPRHRLDSQGIPLRALLMFASLLFLYGGAETCFSGWLTSFTQRSAGAGETASAFCTAAFWVGIATGRGLAIPIFRRYPQSEAIYFLLTGASVCGVGLLCTRSIVGIEICAAACGAFLGPVFPAALAALFALRPTVRQCGLALALCGVGASIMPLLLSMISRATASLRIAILLPSICLLLMLAVVRGLLPLRLEVQDTSERLAF